MEKLSQAGRLYLEHFYILQEAQNDVNNFLNEVVEKTYQGLLEKKDLLPVPKNFTWQIWKNQASPGVIEISPVALMETGLFSKGKVDLHLTYLDVRHDSKLTETDAVSITINSTNRIRKKLKRLPFDIPSMAEEIELVNESPLDFGQRVNNRSQLQLNLDSASESSEIVMEYIIERCEEVEAFVSRLLTQVNRS